MASTLTPTKQLGDQELDYDKKRTFRKQGVRVTANPNIVTLSWKPSEDSSEISCSLKIPNDSDLRDPRELKRSSSHQEPGDRVFSARTLSADESGNTIISKTSVCVNPERGQAQSGIVTFSLLSFEGEGLTLRYLFSVNIWSGEIQYSNEGRDYEGFPVADAMELSNGLREIFLFF